MAFLIAIIAYDIRDISFVRAILAFSFLGSLVLGCSLAIILDDVGPVVFSPSSVLA